MKMIEMTNLLDHHKKENDYIFTTQRTKKQMKNSFKKMYSNDKQRTLNYFLKKIFSCTKITERAFFSKNFIIFLFLILTLISKT